MIEITIKGEAEEVAALVVAIQERQGWEIMLDGKKIVQNTRREERLFRT